MRFRLPFKLVLVVATAISGVAFLGAKTLINTHDSTVPVVFEVTPANPAPNTQVTIKVELDGPSPTGQVVAIGSTDPQAFVNLPSEVIIPAGEASCSFTATTSQVYTRWAVLAATSNGGTALAIQPW